MRISDWSSDVCSSDLRAVAATGANTSPSCKTGKKPGIESPPQWAPRSEHGSHADLSRLRKANLRPRGQNPRAEEASHGRREHRYLRRGFQAGGSRPRGDGSDIFQALPLADELASAHVCTPVNTAHIVCRLLLANNTSKP